MIVVGTTLTTFAVLDPERSFLWSSWLRNAEAIQDSHEDVVQYFAAIEIDARGEAPFRPLLDRLEQLGGTYWTYSLNDHRTSVTQANRGRHITFGQNLISEYATAHHATHLLHMAADCEPPADVLPKLLAVRNGIAAAECSTYCMALGNRERVTRPTFRIEGDPGFPVEIGPMTAVCVLLERELFKSIKWRWDPDLGKTDDPSFSYDAWRRHGVRTMTRMDCVAIHHPQAIGAIETRFPGLDMSTPQE